MNKLLLGLISASFLTFGMNALADNTKDCEKLKDDYNIIYAAKGFCFKDPESKAKYGNENCTTSKPKFSEKEQEKLDAIKERQKELNCK